MWLVHEVLNFALIDKFRYIKIHPQTIDLSMRLWGINTVSIYHLNGIFGSFFWTNGTALFSPLRKRNRLIRIIWSEFSDATGIWVHIMSTRNMAAELPVMLDDLEKFFFLGEGHKFLFWLLQHPHFIRETSNQRAHFFSHDVAQVEAHWNPKSCKYKTDHRT